jgi:hypothetical protein
MGFEPTYHNLSERTPWKIEYFNQLVQDIDEALSNLQGVDFSTPLELETGLNIDGGRNALYGFSRWFGSSAGTGVLDVTGFGATGDLSTDDSGAIQRAINALPATGGCVFFPPGRYILHDTIRMEGSDGTVRSNVTLMGCGYSSQLRWFTGITDRPIIAMNSTSGQSSQFQTIMNLHVHGSATSGADNHNGVTGIDMDNTLDAQLQNAWVSEVEGDGISVTGATAPCIYNTVIKGIRLYGISQATENKTCDRAIIRGVNIIGTTEDIGDVSTKVMRDGIRLLGGRGIMLADVTVKNAGRTGIRIGTTTSGTVDLVTIADAMIYGSQHNGIWIQAEHKSIEKIVITGSMVYESGSDGLRIEGGENSQVRGFAVSGCLFNKNDHNGIRLSEYVEHGVITGTACTANSQNPSGQYDGISVGSTTGGEVSQIAITGNVCVDKEATQKQKYGIELGTSAENCLVFGNDVGENNTAGLLNQGTDNSVAHNQGY